MAAGGGRRPLGRYGGGMPCFTLLLALLSPRIALVWVALTTDLPSEATGSVLVPLLGFFFLPWTTLAYILMWSLGTNEVTGLEWGIVLVALLADLGVWGGGSRKRR